MTWEADDNRDELTHDTELDACAECGAAWNEACDFTCPCAYCTGRRARDAARRAVEQNGEDAA